MTENLLEPPGTHREDVEEHVGGIRICDPYRWMERGGPDLERWVDAQHRHTVERLATWPARKRLHTRFQELLELGSVHTPIVRGDTYFYRRRRKGQALSVLCARTGFRGAERLLLDPRQLSDDRSLSLSGVFVSADGKLAVCKLTRRGTSHATLRVLDLERGRLLEDAIPAELYPLARTRPGVSVACWEPDNVGFYYTRIPEGTPIREQRYHQKLYFHRLGDAFSDDTLVFGAQLRREQTPYPRLSADGRFLVVQVLDLSAERATTEVLVRDRCRPELGFRPLLTGLEALFECMPHRDVLYVQTNLDAPRGRIVAIPLAGTGADQPVTRDVVPEGHAVLRSFAVVGDRLFVDAVHDVASRLRVYDLEGRQLEEVALPGIGSLGQLRAEPEGRELFFSFSSFSSPPAVYRLAIDGDGEASSPRGRRATPVQEPESWIGVEPPLDAARFEVAQVWFESSDDTRVPMFLVHAQGLELDGNNPAVLGGYGGFNESKLPSYDASIVPFLESGGVYALVNVRGGGELGEAWHRAGTRANKQNAFDDFIAAAQWLITAGYTRPERLGCFGWSNGGLLVNAAAQQRPDLWRAVVAGAPVTDMARFHLGPGGRNWIADYGNPEDPEEARALLRYSPYHNMPERIAAPAVLFWVPREDDRVAPWHGYKMLALWQAANAGVRPALLASEANAGHRGRVDIAGRASRYADIWTFLFSELGLRLPSRDAYREAEPALEARHK